MTRNEALRIRAILDSVDLTNAGRVAELSWLIDEVLEQSEEKPLAWFYEREHKGGFLSFDRAHYDPNVFTEIALVREVPLLESEYG